jgi:hypothetical protein
VTRKLFLTLYIAIFDNRDGALFPIILHTTDA